MINSNLVKKILIAAIILIILGAIGYFIYYQLFFFVTSTNPANGSKPNMLLSEITINFNKKLVEEDKDKVVMQPFVEKEIKVEDKKIIVKLRDPIKASEKYTISLYDIKSVDNKIIKYYTFSFTGGNINYNNLSKQDKQKISNGDDQKVNSIYYDQFLLSLPKENIKYKITYSFPNGPDKQPQYKIILYAILNRPDQYDEYYQQLRDYKKEALDYFRANGKDPTKLDIVFEPPEAVNY